VRELENVIERAITLRQGGRISPEDLPPKVLGGEAAGAERLQPPDDLADLFVGLPTIDDIERRYLLRVLEATGGNRTRAAEILGINRRTLYRMAARFRIDLEGRRSAGD
jgi:transcriptional regulator of acetoin/glycerol metabolism